jgi:hypothetical protein
MLGHEPYAAEPMDQPLTTISDAADQAASDAMDHPAPFGRARATSRSLGAARLFVLAATVSRPAGRTPKSPSKSIDQVSSPRKLRSCAPSRDGAPDPSAVMRG